MTSINPLDYFKTIELDSKYDFNGDGTVTITDYYYAKFLIENDPDNDIDISAEDLDKVFAALKEQEKEDYPDHYKEIDPSKSNTEAEKIIAAINSEATSPSSATTLNDLQRIGANLTKYIKQCAELAKVMEGQIGTLKDEVNELEELKKAKEAEYADIEEQIETETETLDKKLEAVLNDANKNNRNYQKQTEDTVARCIKAYAEGEYPNETLYNVITKELALSAGLNTSDLKRELNNCTRKGEEIKSLCNNIYNLVVDLREVESKYKDKNTYLNRTVNNRADLLSSAELANTKYQTGYAVRETMRDELIKKYYVQSNRNSGGDIYSSSNPQVQKLAAFLNAKELDNMPYADALAVMFGYTKADGTKIKGAFTECGMSYNAQTGVITIPKGHDDSATNIFNALARSLYKNYGVNAERPDDDAFDEETPDGTKIARNDPIGFTVGNIKYDFIQDNNNDGVFNDMSEFLGAQNGWQDMFAYDKNGDGTLTGDELKALKLIGKNQDNGQYTFTNAAAVGVKSIDLNSYKEVNQKEQNHNIIAGTFEVNLNGNIIEGKNTFDGTKNLNNEFAVAFGSEIKDLDSTYEENPFLKDFEETLNSKEVSRETENSISETKDDIKHSQKRTELKVEEIKSEGVTEAKIAKNRNDAKAKRDNTSNNESTKAQSATVNTTTRKTKK